VAKMGRGFMTTLAGIGAAIKSYLPVYGGSWMGIIRDTFPGAWQMNVQPESTQNILAFSSVYTSVSLISDDVSKLRPKLMRITDTIGLTQEVKLARSPLGAVLGKPNRYQTHVQFYSQWMVQKLLYGNTYVLLERDVRGVVTDEYILCARYVYPLVADDGSVWYELSTDYLTGVNGPIRVPASEIIHDRMICPFHPLIGVSPIYAAGISATQGMRIQGNSAKFFENMSRPSGVLSTQSSISTETVAAMKEQFEKNFSGGNLGRLLVAGDGLKYEAMSIPPEDAQLIEQLKFTAEDVGRTFKIPLYKLGLGQPTLTTVGALNQEYYSQTLQVHLEAIEALQGEALGLNAAGYEMEFDLEGLLRMDPISRAERNKVSISAGYVKPNEARLSENYPPAEGGDECYLQQQNFSLPALAKRDAKDDPFQSGGGNNAPPPAVTPPAVTPPALPPPPPAKLAVPTEQQEMDARELTNAIIARFLAEAIDGA
jgi:HK97 family phage portal protein